MSSPAPTNPFAEAEELRELVAGIGSTPKNIFLTASKNAFYSSESMVSIHLYMPPM